MIAKPYPFATERLQVRELLEDDAPFMLELVNDQAWLQYIGDRNVHSIEEAAAYLRNGAIAMYGREGFGLWCVVLAATGRTIGICGLIKRETLVDVDLGFAFLPMFRRAGFAREAALATLNYARTVLGITRVVAIVAPENARSVALLEKIGFTFEKSQRLPPPHRDQETHLYVHTSA